MCTETYLYEDTAKIPSTGIIYRKIFGDGMIVRDPNNNYNRCSMYLSNENQFWTDYIEFSELRKTYSVYFDVNRSDGLFYSTYTYIPGSMNEVSPEHS